MVIGVSKGRVQEEFFRYAIEKEVLEPGQVKYTRNLVCTVGFDDYCLLKASDIISCLQKGCIDIGILGSDVIDEASNNDIVEIYDMNSLRCYFALASFPETRIKDIRTVATKYPNIAARIRQKLGLNFDIVTMSGSLEIAPNLGYADAIIDIVQSGRTLLENGLEEKERFANINTKFVTTRDRSYDNDINSYVRKYKY